MRLLKHLAARPSKVYLLETLRCGTDLDGPRAMLQAILFLIVIYQPQNRVKETWSTICPIDNSRHFCSPCRDQCSPYLLLNDINRKY